MQASERCLDLTLAEFCVVAVGRVVVEPSALGRYPAREYPGLRRDDDAAVSHIGVDGLGERVRLRVGPVQRDAYRFVHYRDRSRCVPVDGRQRAVEATQRVLAIEVAVAVDDQPAIGPGLDAVDQPDEFGAPPIRRPTPAAYRRKASGKPPSTGITCPVVRVLCSPASHTMAAAQASGVTGRLVKVRCA